MDGSPPTPAPSRSARCPARARAGAPRRSPSRVSRAPRARAARPPSRGGRTGSPPRLRHQIGAHRAHPFAHAEARLDEPHLLVRVSPPARSGRSPRGASPRDRPGASTRSSRIGSGSRAANDVAQNVEARLVRPLQPVDDDDERLLQRDRGEQAADAVHDDRFFRRGRRRRRRAPTWRFVASSASRATIGLDASPCAAPLRPAR